MAGPHFLHVNRLNLIMYQVFLYNFKLIIIKGSRKGLVYVKLVGMLLFYTILPIFLLQIFNFINDIKNDIYKQTKFDFLGI